MLKDYLDSKFGRGQVAGDDTIYACPFCSHRKLYVITDNTDEKFGVYHCFHCSASGSLVKLIATINNISFSEARHLLPSIDKYAVTESNVALFDTTPEESLLAVLLKSQDKLPKEEKSKAIDLTKITIPDKKPPVLPIGLKFIADNEEEAKPFINYLFGRGLTWQDIVYDNIGYIVHGGTFTANNTFLPITNHIVFFCYDALGNYQYWNTRAIYPSQIKSINAPEVEYHLGKGDVVYNLYPAMTKASIILVEGVPDALTLGVNAIATYGKQLTNVQKALILYNIKPAQGLYLMLDMDAWQTMASLANELYKYHENTYIVYNPTRLDANALGREQAYEIINNNLIKATPKGIKLFELLANMY
jgi:DNA primase